MLFINIESREVPESGNMGKSKRIKAERKKTKETKETKETKGKGKGKIGERITSTGKGEIRAEKPETSIEVSAENYNILRMTSTPQADLLTWAVESGQVDSLIDTGRVLVPDTVTEIIYDRNM